MYPTGARKSFTHPSRRRHVRVHIASAGLAPRLVRADVRMLATRRAGAAGLRRDPSLPAAQEPQLRDHVHVIPARAEGERPPPLRVTLFIKRERE